MAIIWSQRNCTHKTKVVGSHVISLLDNAGSMFRLNGKRAQNPRCLPALLSDFILTKCTLR